MSISLRKGKTFPRDKEGWRQRLRDEFEYDVTRGEVSNLASFDQWYEEWRAEELIVPTIVLASHPTISMRIDQWKALKSDSHSQTTGRINASSK